MAKLKAVSLVLNNSVSPAIVIDVKPSDAVLIVYGFFVVIVLEMMCSVKSCDYTRLVLFSHVWIVVEDSALPATLAQFFVNGVRRNAVP